MNLPIISDGFSAALMQNLAWGLEAVVRNEAQFFAKLDAI